MPKTLDDVKQALEGLDGGIELYEAVSNAILHEKNRGIKETQEANRQAKVAKDALKALGYDATTQDLEGFVASINEKLETGKGSSEKLSATEQRFRAQEKKTLELQSALEKTISELTDERTKNTHAVMKDALLKAFSGKIYSAEVHAKDLIRDGKVALNDDKTISFIHGENKLDFDAGIAKYLESNQDAIINAQRGGPGGGPTSSSSSSSKVMVRSAYDKMDPFQAAEYIKGGGKLID